MMSIMVMMGWILVMGVEDGSTVTTSNQKAVEIGTVLWNGEFDRKAMWLV